MRGALEGIHPGQLLVADVTGDGRDEILALCDLGGVGGAGSWDLAVWTLQDGALSSLPLALGQPEDRLQIVLGGFVNLHGPVSSPRQQNLRVLRLEYHRSCPFARKGKMALDRCG